MVTHEFKTSLIEYDSFENEHNQSEKKNPAARSTFSPGLSVLTHWVRDKMDAISQTAFLSAFSWMKMF